MKPYQYATGAIFAGVVGFAAFHAAHAQPAQPAMPGVLGKMEFKPMDFTGENSYWYDTDGVDPGVAGCHVGVQSETFKNPNGRSFGEACQSSSVLIESNPGKGIVHSHEDDVGEPYLVNCDTWCKDAKHESSGSCVAAEGPPPCDASARCECK